jgi:hypothetical protein
MEGSWQKVVDADATISKAALIINFINISNNYPQETQLSAI